MNFESGSGFRVRSTNYKWWQPKLPNSSQITTTNIQRFYRLDALLIAQPKSQYNIDQRQYNPVSRAQVTGRAEFTSEQLRMREINTTSGAEFTDVLKFECFLPMVLLDIDIGHCLV